MLISAAFCLSAPTFSQTSPTGLQVTPLSIDFGESLVDSPTLPRAIAVSNPTNAPIALEQIITSGIDFSEKHDCGQSLAPGAQCTIQITFTPAISGPRTGNLDIMGSDLASPHFVALNGEGK